MGREIFITGTGTDIGKSALSLAVLSWAAQKRIPAAYHKPVQCGDFPFGTPPLPCDDAGWIQALLPGPIRTSVTYKFRDPVSPHLAAERAGATINPEAILRDIKYLGAHGLTVVEGAGGAAAPLDRHGASLATVLADTPCLIACAPGLGTLHHTLSTVAFLRQSGCRLAGFAFVHREETVPEITEDNTRTLSESTGLAFFGSVPFLRALSRREPLAETDSASLHSGIDEALDTWWRKA